ncbi:hypothetical protein ABR772_25755 [Bacillus cereus]|uniref:hypothetical protein n=1 Tax=Bacillus cereus TaxID=1396 RepID=UPI0035570B37
MHSEQGTIEVGLKFNDSPKIEIGYIKSNKPLDIQLEERFIPIKLHGMWKHISTRRINEIWEAKTQRHLL